MNGSKSFPIIFTAFSLIVLASCSGGNQATTPTPTPAVSLRPATSPSVISSETSVKSEANRKSGGGMVVESGAYHLELMPEKEAGKTHLDLFLQKQDTHESVPTAKVTAQVQLPDGAEKTLDMIYSSDGRHYTAKLETDAAGEYKVIIQSVIGSEKVNARYTFKQ